MRYETLELIAKYIQWALVIAIGIITFRIGYIAYTYFTIIEDASAKATVEKIKKYLKAAIICSCVVGIVEFIKSYYF